MLLPSRPAFSFVMDSYTALLGTRYAHPPQTFGHQDNSMQGHGIYRGLLPDHILCGPVVKRRKPSLLGAKALGLLPPNNIFQ